MLPLIYEQLKLHQDATECYIFGKRFLKKFSNDKNYRKVRNHCHFTGKYRDATHSICKLKFNILNEIPVVFYKDSNCDYHFVIKVLANKSERQFECRGENTENFSCSNRKRRYKY